MSRKPKGAFGGKAKNIPERDTLLLPYQAAWVRDKARLKMMEKSRQIGMTWASAYEIVTDTGMVDSLWDVWISSRDDIQARLFLEDCKAFASLLNIGAQDLGEQIVDDQRKHSAQVLQFANGRRANSMSSNPDAQAGKRGARRIDEYALHREQRKMWAIAYPGITWGGTLAAWSTHRGSDSFFNELINEARHKGNPKGISLHRVTLQDALDQGFLYKLQQKLPAGDERLDMDEADYFTFIRAGCADEESFQQEFMCVPADDASAFLSYDLISTCQLHGADDLQVQTEETRAYDGRKGKIRRLQSLTLAQIRALPGELFLGVDVGREHDLTVLWLLVRMAGMLVPVAIVEMAAVEFARQESELYAFLSLPNLRRCCVDNTGIGRQFGERAQRRFGQYKVELVTFTPAVKEELAYPVRSAFEDRSVRVPSDKFITSDLRAIRREVTAAGNVRFAADRGKNGHSDRFWALGLAIHAGKKPGSLFVPRSFARQSGRQLARRIREVTPA